MAIDFTATFGKNSGNVQGNVQGNAGKPDKPKAQLWLNFGYLSDVVDEETGKRRFVAAPVGIPLDTMEKLDTRTSNREYGQFLAARNDVVDQLLATPAIAELKPGEDIVQELVPGGFAIQIRRVNPEREAQTVGEGNPFARKLALGAAA